ncbi:MAG TPA: hypothetical protein VIE68_07580 [Gemmatimonadota bacterium]|jgi:hypothetical protein
MTPSVAGPRASVLAGLLVALALAAPLNAQDASPAADSRPSAVSLRLVPEPPEPGAPEPTVGDALWATVRAFGPSGTFLLPASVIEAYAPHPELAILGSERRDGQLRLELALFRPGDVVLPTVEARIATSSGDTVTVPVVSDTFHVASVLAPGDTLLADIKPLWPEPGAPPWVWLALAALLALLFALGWWWWRRRRGGAAAETAGLDPYADARRRIEELAAEPPTAAARIGAAAGIAEALRGYLADAWRTPARERTTFEILHALPEPLAGDRPALGALMTEIDLAKYARLAPLPGRIPGLAARALDWLEGAEGARQPPALEPGEEAAS